MNMSKTKNISVLLLLLSISCSTTGSNRTSPYPSSEFHYDESFYSFIRLFEYNDTEILGKYNKWILNKPYKSYEFYESYVLGLSKSYFDTTNGFEYEKVTQKPKLETRPTPEFPDTNQMMGKYLKLVITVVVDTLGNSEFVTLFDLYRDPNGNKKANSECNPVWSCTKIYDLDKPYIKSAIYAAQKIKFLPAEFDGIKRKVRINIPYEFHLD